jgi:hypothetical protein
VPALLDERVMDFLQHRVMVSVASRNADNVPSLLRALGFHADAARQRMAVFVLTRHAERLLADIDSCGQVAVVFSEPSTHRTLQVKAQDAVVGALEEGDWLAVAAHLEAAVAELAPLGYSEAWVRTLFQSTPARLQAVRFTPSSAFGQTPGPSAGAPLQGALP